MCSQKVRPAPVNGVTRRIQHSSGSNNNTASAVCTARERLALPCLQPARRGSPTSPSSWGQERDRPATLHREWEGAEYVSPAWKDNARAATASADGDKSETRPCQHSRARAHRPCGQTGTAQPPPSRQRAAGISEAAGDSGCSPRTLTTKGGGRESKVSAPRWAVTPSRILLELQRGGLPFAAPLPALTHLPG
jgi:hypothetical protein